MERKDFFDLANARAKADFISRELSNYYEKHGTNMISVAVKIYTPDEPSEYESKRIQKAVEYLSDLYDDMISPVFEAYI